MAGFFKPSLKSMKSISKGTKETDLGKQSKSTCQSHFHNHANMNKNYLSTYGLIDSKGGVEKANTHTHTYTQTHKHKHTHTHSYTHTQFLYYKTDARTY